MIKTHGKNSDYFEKLAKLYDGKIKYFNPLVALEPWKANILSL